MWELILTDLKIFINALGGIDVDSECAFSAKGYSYSQGINYNMNGDKALVFARERKSLQEVTYSVERIRCL